MSKPRSVILCLGNKKAPGLAAGRPHTVPYPKNYLAFFEGRTDSFSFTSVAPLPIRVRR